MQGNISSFLARCNEAREQTLRMKRPHIVGHFDADGLTSSSITAAFLAQEKISFTIQNVKKLSPSLIHSLKNKEELIFTDLGSGAKEMDELKGSVVVLDHHQRAGIAHLEVNPYLFNFNGDTHISAAGICYFVFKTHAHLGIVGAVGDVQSPLSDPESLNSLMLQEAQSQGLAKRYYGLRLFGKASRSLAQMLFFADDPYLPGISGDLSRCEQFLSSCGLAQKNSAPHTYLSLSEEEQGALISALAQYLSKDGSATTPSHLVCENYLLHNQPPNTELYDASEFSTLLNACGRNNEPQTGVGVCLGNPDSIRAAISLLALHRKNLREGIGFAQRNLEDFGPFLFLDGRSIISDSIIGVVAGMLVGRAQKPILAIALDSDAPNMLKISTRATKSLVQAGLNLGATLNECASYFGGAGGGHKIAAGATIPMEKLDSFLLVFAKSLRK
ncbi:DHH family phosphoesterase [Candidatus Micrarchaeota archaeon]|nr:DHH family phosphoesterase [Candidatus Micrarchaeota archaeon]